MTKNNTTDMPSLRIGVFGHGCANHLTAETLGWVERFGACVAEGGGTLYTGGGGGVMLAARRGCLARGGAVVSINPDIDIRSEAVNDDQLGCVIATGQGKIGRVHLLTQSIDFGFALGGGAGTLLEIVSCYLLAKPIVVVDGFQKETDPTIPALLTRFESHEIDGVAVRSGYLDGKDSRDVCPVAVVSREAKPEQVHAVGISYWRLRGGKSHKM